jgi:hypothetical protein
MTDHSRGRSSLIRGASSARAHSRVMSPTSYQAAPPRIKGDRETVTGEAAGQGLVDLASRDVRFWGKVDWFAGPGACWPWLGGIGFDGYGRFHYGQSETVAHRYSLELALGRRLGPGEVARHTCHRRDCVNPAHLLPGTKADNSQDMVLAGRSLRGERNPRGKLTEAQVVAIRETVPHMGRGRFERVGRAYGITGRQVAYLVRGQRWAVSK